MTEIPQPLPPPGLYDDGSGYLRWWDGTAWGDYASSMSPADAAPTPAVTPGRGGSYETHVASGNVLSPAFRQEPPEGPADPVGGVLALIGAAAGMTGSLAPWLSAGDLGFSGLDSAGPLTFALLSATLLAAVLTLIGQAGWVRGIALAALPAVAVSAFKLVDINSSLDELTSAGVEDAAIGWGLWLAMIGSTTALTGGLIALISSRRPRY